MLCWAWTSQVLWLQTLRTWPESLIFTNIDFICLVTLHFLPSLVQLLLDTNYPAFWPGKGRGT